MKPMKRNSASRNLAFGLIALVAALSACSSKKSKEAEPVKRVDMKHTEWDYQKIREVREAEKVQLPPLPANDDKNCVVMSHEQMVRAKVSGCRKLDPRAGQGEEAYCCPRE